MVIMRSNTKSNIKSFDDYCLMIRTANTLGELSALRLAIVMDKHINDNECLMLCQMVNEVTERVNLAWMGETDGVVVS